MVKKTRKLDELKSSPSNFLRKFRRKNSVGEFFLYVLIIFALHSVLENNFADAVRSFCTSIAVYADKFAENLQSDIDHIRWTIFGDAGEIIANLKRENLKLQHKIDELTHLERENDELRQMLSLKNDVGSDVHVARVLRSFSNDYVRSFVLDVGAIDGVSLDDVVVNVNGLVGRIVEVDQNWSKVMLITDTNSNVPVKIGNDMVNAIVSGDNTSTLKVSMIYEDNSIDEGDIAETSGYGNVFRDKIPVGKIIKEEDGSYYVAPFVNFNKTTYVSILKKNRFKSRLD
ncbi:MAG: rod shape-determining protein MreC [Holosporaceae bacterium]|jgi:rod shape-determining protein MreC|nr:rod shape-determining protein MreC [Holosporaceae bacterium]